MRVGNASCLNQRCNRDGEAEAGHIPGLCIRHQSTRDSVAGPSNDLQMSIPRKDSVSTKIVADDVRLKARQPITDRKPLRVLRDVDPSVITPRADVPKLLELLPVASVQDLMHSCRSLRDAK